MKKQISLLTMLIVCNAYLWANGTDELTYTSFFTACTPTGSNISGSYTAFSNVNGANSDAVYAGFAYKHGDGPSNCHDYIQIRSSNNDSGIITTTSGGKAKKVTVSWSSALTTSRTLNVYGKNTAYSSAADLYSEEAATQGTLIGTIVYDHSTPANTTTELTISTDYQFIGLRSNSGAIYLDDISIEWSTKTLV